MISYLEMFKAPKVTMKLFVKTIVLFIFFFQVPLLVTGSDFPPKPKNLVNDYAGILNNQQINDLERKLVAFDDSTSNQITLVTVKDLGGYEVADYAVNLGNQWGVGQSGKKNGIVFLIAPNERKVTIQTGYGLEPVLPDIIAGRIIREQVAPSFRNGNYYEGIDKAIDAIILYTGSEFKAEPEADNPYLILFLILGFLLLLLLFAYLTRNMTSQSRQIIRGGGHSWNGGGSNWGGGFGGWGGGSSGGGSSGGGGFGGFGGGSFGGGGASGSW
ncbi:MAG: TPM domain-containing protein [Saprospiraceae bacterium]|nr:TPM domain-containing protein [Saprospiraceae bacterium]